MTIDIGEIDALFSYPVKSMRGHAIETAALGWHGLEGDRRFAFRRLDDHGGFPWLTASRFPGLLRYTPEPAGPDDHTGPAHVLTPEGKRLPLRGEALAAEVGRHAGGRVEMMHLKHGVFDDAAVSVITSGTAAEIGRLSGRDVDVRRFRPNIVVRSTRAVPFEEDGWVGGVLSFGDASDAPAVSVTQRDLRCVMVNLDPDDASAAPEVMKAVLSANQNYAGIYGTIIRAGRLRAGQRIRFHPRT